MTTDVINARQSSRFHPCLQRPMASSVDLLTATKPSVSTNLPTAVHFDGRLLRHKPIPALGDSQHPAQINSSFNTKAKNNGRYMLLPETCVLYKLYEVYMYHDSSFKFTPSPCEVIAINVTQRNR
jgi:hypothetical protein